MRSTFDLTCHGVAIQQISAQLATIIHIKL